MDYNELNVSDKVAWNLSGQLIQELADHLRQASNHYLNGQIEQAFYRLKVIRQRIVHSLKPDERTACTDCEKLFNNNSFCKVNQKEKFRQGKIIQYETYDKYNTLIMDFLEAYGYLIKKQEDNTRINV